ncbi:MAG: glycosyltransferase family 2 protein [Pseudomonadota bacterium]
MASNPPLISVVMPVFNKRNSVRRSVASVRQQSEADWELLLIDDGSTDGADALLRDLASEDNRITLLGWPDNRGAAAARNAGIQAAKGRYIAFLDADDAWLPEKLAIQREHMERIGAGFVFSGYRRLDPSGRPLGDVQVPTRITYRDLLKRNVVGCLTAVYDTEVHGKVEMPDVRRRQDYGLWLRLLRDGGEAHGIDQVLAEYTVGGSSLSSNKMVAAQATWRILRDQEGLALPQAAWCFAHYAGAAVGQRLAHRVKR